MKHLHQQEHDEEVLAVRVREGKLHERDVGDVDDDVGDDVVRPLPGLGLHQDGVVLFAHAGHLRDLRHQDL